MKFSRNASANWKGSGKEGKGTLSTESTILKDTQYSFKSRFEDGKGTNPEELVYWERLVLRLPAWIQALRFCLRMAV